MVDTSILKSINGDKSANIDWIRTKFETDW